MKKFIAKKLNLSSFNEVIVIPQTESVANLASFVELILLKVFGVFCFYIFGDFKSEKKNLGLFCGLPDSVMGHSVARRGHGEPPNRRDSSGDGRERLRCMKGLALEEKHRSVISQMGYWLGRG